MNPRNRKGPITLQITKTPAWRSGTKEPNDKLPQETIRYYMNGSFTVTIRPTATYALWTQSGQQPAMWKITEALAKNR